MSTTNRRFLLLSLLLALLAGLLFTPGLPGEFFFDDIPNIVNNDSIQLRELTPSAVANVIATPQASGQMRGIPTLTFALDYWRSGGAIPGAFKATNILIHVLTAAALAWLFRSLLLLVGITEQRSRVFALGLTFAWAAHPLLVSSVLYTVQRLQTLGTLFLVLALLAYLQARRAQIAGQFGRTALLVSALLWALAMDCKEDSVLLPAYTLSLELTVLKFAAADPGLANRYRRGYLIATLAGVAIFVLVAIPSYWSQVAYDGRNFNTPERLLTEARVLCLYLWQIVVPLPSHMPFYYDWLQPSRGLLQPWTTLPAILLVFVLLAIAWRLRARWPLFSLGIFLFFSAHFITANIVGVELVFEHRNHFALIGAVLAIGSLLGHIGQRLQLRRSVQVASACTLLLALGSATVLRAQEWSSNYSLARAITLAAPHSARAWIQLCAETFKAGGGPVAGNPLLGQAIAACSQGDKLAPYALNNTALLLVLKTLNGDVTRQDWNHFQQRMNTVDMSWDNQRAPLILTYHLSLGVKLDKQQLRKAMETLARRGKLTPDRVAEIGYFFMNDLADPDAAMPYFIRAIIMSPPEDPFQFRLAEELRAKGRPDLADKIALISADMLRRSTHETPTSGQ